MKRRLGLFVFLLGSVTVACASTEADDAESADSAQRRGNGAATPAASAVLQSSPIFQETKTLAPTDANAARAWAIFQLSPLTPCDVALFADAEDATLETDPTNFAAWAGGAPVKAPKKKVSFQEARVLGGTYLAFQDPDAKKVQKVKGAWVSVLINRGLDASKRLTTVPQKPGGPNLSSASINECNTYVDSITQSTWGCLQHLVADYLATKEGRDKLADAPGSLGKLPFYGHIAAGPAGTRNLVPTVSNRTMKALSGYLPKVGKQQELQQLAADAVKYFESNSLDDPRVAPGPANWKGYWEIDKNGQPMAYCGFDDAKSELQ